MTNSSVEHCVANGTELMNVCPAAEKSDIIGPEGMEKFCEDIGVEPENVCWHFCHRNKMLFNRSLYSRSDV